MCVENYTTVVYSYDQSADNGEETKATAISNYFYYLWNIL